MLDEVELLEREDCPRLTGVPISESCAHLVIDRLRERMIENREGT